VAAERTLTRRELNRALLARQLLLDRAPSPIPKALDRIGGIQAQYAPSMYIGLWSRLRNLERDAVSRALERRSVVQGTLMRATIHLVSARDYWPISIGVRRARREQYLRYPGRDVTAKQVAPAARRLRSALAKGPMSRAEIDELLDKPGAALINGLGLWVDLVRVPPAGTWERRRADVYAAAEDWLGAPEADEGQGVELLVKRYLGGFGPAPRSDIANWAGLHPKALEPALKRLRLRRFRGEDGEELLDLPRAPLPDPDTPAPVRFLPVWDATLLVHARRTGILPEEFRSRVFNVRTPQSVNTFLVDGEVAGTWRYEKRRVKPETFGRLDRATRRELDAEAERLAVFHG
jgi:Winged helix DNA-binding domain